jgi:acyl dehydratase
MTAFPPPDGEGPPPLQQRLTQARIDAYAKASGDHNPIHLDPAFARAVGLPSTIAHGLLTLGAACAEVELWAEQAAWTAAVSCRFAAPVPSGQTLTGHPQVVESRPELVVVELDAIAESGERVLTKASLELRPLREPAG